MWVQETGKEGRKALQTGERKRGLRYANRVVKTKVLYHTGPKPSWPSGGR